MPSTPMHSSAKIVCHEGGLVQGHPAKNSAAETRKCSEFVFVLLEVVSLGADSFGIFVCFVFFVVCFLGKRLVSCLLDFIYLLIFFLFCLLTLS